jgi:hypothetical protein
MILVRIYLGSPGCKKPEAFSPQKGWNIRYLVFGFLGFSVFGFHENSFSAFSALSAVKIPLRKLW